MVTAADIVAETQNTDAFLEQMRASHKRMLRKSIRSLEDKMVNLLTDLEVGRGGKLEGVKVNLKQTQKLHARMLTLFEEEYGQTVRSVVGDYGEVARHIQRSWRSLGESVNFTDVDRSMLASLQGQSFNQFGQFGEAAQMRMADAMYGSVVAGTSYAQLVKTVRGILRGKRDVRGRSMQQYADTYAFDSVMNFHNDVNMSKAGDLGIKKFMYVGDVITTTRQFCRTRAGKLYTKAQIERWNALSWSGKSGPPLTNRGGYNCRHHWRAFKDEWLDEADEVEETITKKKKPKAPPVGKPKGKAGSSREVLSSGSVSASGKVAKGGVNTTEIKTLQYAGREIRGAFKPISGEAFRDVGGVNWEPYLHLKKCPQAYREVMASQIDDALGFGLVPSTIMRKLDGELGSLQEWIEGSVTALSMKKPMTIAAKQIYKSTIFDSITGNVDRHRGNWLVNLKTGKMTLIDNGLSFCQGTNPRSLIPSWYQTMSPGKSKDDLIGMINASFGSKEKASLISNLKSLDLDSICEQLTSSELRAMKKRISYVIERIQSDTIGGLTFSKKLNAK